MALLDIVIFLLIGAFIVSRFMGFKLPHDHNKPQRGQGQRGQRGGRGQPSKRGQPNVLDFPKTPDEKHVPENVVGGEDEGTYAPLPAKAQKPKELSGLAVIQAVEPTFNSVDFLAGAKVAYKYYYDMYNAKDDDALSNLLAPILLNDTIATFNALDAKNHTPQIKVEKVEKATVVDARLNGKTMLIDVQFTAKQSENMLSKTGKIVGKEKPVKVVKSLWTFAKPAQSEDPNWDVQVIQKAS